uniref:Uncharacterized protein n=1 Tax=Arundo donax TaxID=35708 RepID=A0A0A9DST9_ARUDO
MSQIIDSLLCYEVNFSVQLTWLHQEVGEWITQKVWQTRKGTTRGRLSLQLQFKVANKIDA